MNKRKNSIGIFVFPCFRCRSISMLSISFFPLFIGFNSLFISIGSLLQCFVITIRTMCVRVRVLCVCNMCCSCVLSFQLFFWEIKSNQKTKWIYCINCPTKNENKNIKTNSSISSVLQVCLGGKITEDEMIEVLRYIVIIITSAITKPKSWYRYVTLNVIKS